MPLLAGTQSSPRRFARPSLLIVGCGDIGLRVAKLLGGRYRIVGMTSDPQRAGVLRAAGVVPLVGNLDRPHTLQRFAGLADAVLHLAPPPAEGARDTRTASLLATLARRGGGQRIIILLCCSCNVRIHEGRIRAVLPWCIRSSRRF